MSKLALDERKINTSYNKFITKVSAWVGGENETNYKEIEWPTDEYLEEKGKEDINNIKNYRIEHIPWHNAIAHGEKEDLCAALRFVNNLGDRSERFHTERMEEEEKRDIDLTGVQIGKIRIKTNYSHVWEFRWFDRDENKVG